MVTMHSTTRRLIMALALGLALLAALPAARASENEVCLPTANYCIPGRLGQFWQQNGGLPIFGNPISAPALETDPHSRRTGQIQWVERGRLEEHAEHAAPYDVLLARLGVERLRQLGRDWQAEGREPGPQPGCLWFRETGHNVCDQDPNGSSAADRGFRSYWEGTGLRDAGLTRFGRSLALHGLPLTTARMETTASGQMVLTQWFERGRFEWHPDNPPGFRVVLGLLGTEVRAGLVGDGLKYFWPTTLPGGWLIDAGQSVADEQLFALKIGQTGGGQDEATIQGGTGSEAEARPDGQAITVRGRPGMAYTTASGTGIYWEEDGFPYAIIGRILPQDALSIAEGLDAWDLATWQRRVQTLRTPAP